SIYATLYINTFSTKPVKAFKETIVYAAVSQLTRFRAVCLGDHRWHLYPRCRILKTSIMFS
ncbi:hypothetical protein L9F63_025126, partial [Diploptera punctata]